MAASSFARSIQFMKTPDLCDKRVDVATLIALIFRAVLLGEFTLRGPASTFRGRRLVARTSRSPTPIIILSVL